METTNPNLNQVNKPPAIHLPVLALANSQAAIARMEHLLSYYHYISHLYEVTWMQTHMNIHERDELNSIYAGVRITLLKLLTLARALERKGNYLRQMNNLSSEPEFPDTYHLLPDFHLVDTPNPY